MVYRPQKGGSALTQETYHIDLVDSKQGLQESGDLAALLGLRLDKLGLAVDALQGVPHLQSVLVHVHIFPRQSKRLTLAQTEREGHAEYRASRRSAG